MDIYYKGITLVILVAIFFWQYVISKRLKEFIEDWKTRPERASCYHEVAVDTRPPIHHSYQGGYTDLTICDNCNIVSYHEDAPTSKPCPDCGGLVLIRPVKGKWVIYNNRAYWSN